MVLPLTVSGDEVSEVYSEGDPVRVEESDSVAPQADIHGASSWFWSQPSKEDWVSGEVIHTPALSFIGGKSTRMRNKNTKININKNI